MSSIWRLVILVYNLLFLVLGVGVIYVAMGVAIPLSYINLALASSQNRIITGAVGAVLVILAIIMMVSVLKRKGTSNSIIIDSGLSGQVSITVPALKVIIMKAVRRVEGLKDIRPVITSGPDGLMIYLHMMINPEYSVAEMSKSVQAIVKEYVENIGGLQVAEVKILVDDFIADKRLTSK